MFNVSSWDVCVYETKRRNSRSQQTVSTYIASSVSTLCCWRGIAFSDFPVTGTHVLKPFLNPTEIRLVHGTQTRKHVHNTFVKHTESSIAQVYANESSMNLWKTRHTGIFLKRVKNTCPVFTYGPNLTKPTGSIEARRPSALGYFFRPHFSVLRFISPSNRISNGKIPFSFWSHLFYETIFFSNCTGRIW